MKMKTLSRSFRRDLVTYGMVVVMFLAIQLLSGMGMLTNSLSGQLVPICAYIIMAISLNLTVGILGELSLGHAGFMSVGGFVGGVCLRVCWGRRAGLALLLRWRCWRGPRPQPCSVF